MSIKTLQDFSDAAVERVQPFKHALVNGADHYHVRSARTVVNTRYDTPAIRVELTDHYGTVSLQELKDEHDLEILTAFSTDDGGNLVMIVGPREARDE